MYMSVCGSSHCNEEVASTAYKVGAEIAKGGTSLYVEVLEA
ncbi:MAG: hypothetical protein PHP64_00690 [Actinomycetota bacterium]|nr:hypothetical protein [Actinomycetota bacterium]